VCGNLILMNGSQLLAGMRICPDEEDRGKHPAVAVRSSDAGGMDFGRNTVVWRARIVLLSADRVGVMAIVRSIGKSNVTVGRWQERYLAQGIAGLRRDGTRPGHKPPLNAVTIEQVVHKTLHEQPPAGPHWSSRKMAAASGLSYTSVQRIWKAHELKPHLVKTFKLSNDKQFVEKVQNTGVLGG
jgi:hypothetical protein